MLEVLVLLGGFVPAVFGGFPSSDPVAAAPAAYASSCAAPAKTFRGKRLAAPASRHCLARYAPAS